MCTPGFMCRFQRVAVTVLMGPVRCHWSNGWDRYCCCGHVGPLARPGGNMRPPVPLLDLVRQSLVKSVSGSVGSF